MAKRTMIAPAILAQMALAVALILGTSGTAGAAPPKRPVQDPPCPAWQDDFSFPTLDSTRWVIASGRAPGYIGGSHIGYYLPQNVSISNGILKLTLTQQAGTVDGQSGVISYGALVYSVKKCGYGTYEWRMKMSSTAANATDQGTAVSGSVSAGFNYVNNSETEIDFEFSALDPGVLWLVNWLNTNPRRDPTGAMETYTPVMPFDSVGGFHTYTFVWQPGKITYYIDGQWRAEHTTNVPSAPAYFMINHWGTNGPYWGGPATLGVTRYAYIDRVGYTPPQ
jgi:endo-1,3-1,4-beta-glycanase ExoK